MSAINFDNDNYAVTELLSRIFAAISVNDKCTELALRGVGIIHYFNGQWHTSKAPHVTQGVLDHLFLAVQGHHSVDQIADSPKVSAGLSNGMRIEYARPPATESGTITFSLRIPDARPVALDTYGEDFYQKTVWLEEALYQKAANNDSAESNNSPLAQAISLISARQFYAFFKHAMEHDFCIAIVGTTGSGKTRYLKALAEEIPHDEHIVLVQEVNEFPLPNHINKTYLMFSHATEKKMVSALDAATSTKRLLPSRVIYSETRGRGSTVTRHGTSRYARLHDFSCERLHYSLECLCVWMLAIALLSRPRS